MSFSFRFYFVFIYLPSSDDELSFHVSVKEMLRACPGSAMGPSFSIKTYNTAISRPNITIPSMQYSSDTS